MMEDNDSLSLFGDNNDSIMDLIDQGNGYGDEYVSSPLTKTLINCPSVHVCKINAAEAVVGRVLLSKLTCNHTHNKCNCRTLNRDWMLDSRATVHISPYMADFIDYVPALVKGHVCTAEGPMDLVVEGSGTVLIQHVFHYKGKSHKELLRLQEVLYIPGVIARFTSLVHLLKEGLCIYGDAAGMNLFTRENDKVPLMHAEPWDSKILFWLKAEQPSLNGVESVFTTDYDLLHCRLGHPSKDVQKQTQWHHPSWTLTTIIYMSTRPSTAVSPPSKRLRFSQNSPSQVEAPPLPAPADPPEVALALIATAPSVEDTLSVFNILNIFQCRWFLSRQHLVDSVLSAQKNEDGTHSWVKFSPQFHSHLVKYAVALVPHCVCTVKRVMFVYILELLDGAGHTAFFDLQKGSRKANNAQKEKRRLSRKHS